MKDTTTWFRVSGDRVDPVEVIKETEHKLKIKGFWAMGRGLVSKHAGGIHFVPNVDEALAMAKERSNIKIKRLMDDLDEARKNAIILDECIETRRQQKEEANG